MFSSQHLADSHPSKRASCLSFARSQGASAHCGKEPGRGAVGRIHEAPPPAVSTRWGWGGASALFSTCSWDLPLGGARAPSPRGTSRRIGGNNFSSPVFHPCSSCWLQSPALWEPQQAASLRLLVEQDHQQTCGSQHPPPEPQLGIDCSYTRPSLRAPGFWHPNIYHSGPSPGCGRHLLQILLLRDLSVPVSACWVFQRPYNRVLHWILQLKQRGLCFRDRAFADASGEGPRWSSLFRRTLWFLFLGLRAACFFPEDLDPKAKMRTRPHTSATCPSGALHLPTTGFQTQIRSFIQSAVFLTLSTNPDS